MTKTKFSTMWNRYCFVTILLICAANLLSNVCALDEFSVGRDATADKPQSKAWYHDGFWWCILFNGVEGSYFYRLVREDFL